MDKNVNWGAILLVLMAALAIGSSATLGEVNLGPRDIDLAFGGIQGYLNNTLAVNFNLSGPMNANKFLIDNATVNITGNLTFGASNLTAYPNGTIANAVMVGCNGCGGAGFKVGSFTRNISLASGTQAITGVGFTPKALFFTYTVDGLAEGGTGTGVDDGTNAYAAYSLSLTTAGAGAFSNAYSISTLVTSGGFRYDGEVTTLGTDGFTITWTRTGTPSGTLSVAYIAMG